MGARAKSAFHFDVQDSVAKSTHCGLPWLRYLRQQRIPPPRLNPAKLTLARLEGWILGPP